MFVLVRFYDGRGLSLSVEPSSTVLDLLRKVADRLGGIPTFYQRVIFKGHQLAEDRSLDACGVRDGDFLLVDIRLREVHLPGPVLVNLHNGDTIVVDVGALDTVADIKKKIAGREDVRPEEQRLLYAGRALEDERKLSDYHIMQQFTLELVLRADDDDNGAYDEEDEFLTHPLGSLVLAMRGEAGTSTYYQMRRVTRLERLVEAYAKRQSIEPESVALSFMGRWLRQEDTPHQIGLCEYDALDAFKQDHGVFTWKIKRFNANMGRKLCSDVFTIGGYKWRLIVYPHGKAGNNSLSVYLELTDRHLPPGWNRPAHLTLSVLSQKNAKKSVKRELYHTFSEERVNRGWAEFMSLQELNNSPHAYLYNETVMFQAKVQVFRILPRAPCADCLCSLESSMDEIYLSPRGRRIFLCQRHYLQVRNCFRECIEEIAEALRETRDEERDAVTEMWAQMDWAERKKHMPRSNLVFENLRARFRENPLALASMYVSCSLPLSVAPLLGEDVEPPFIDINADFVRADELLPNAGENVEDTDEEYHPLVIAQRQLTRRVLYSEHNVLFKELMQIVRIVVASVEDAVQRCSPPPQTRPELDDRFDEDINSRHEDTIIQIAQLAISLSFFEHLHDSLVSRRREHVQIMLQEALIREEEGEKEKERSRSEAKRRKKERQREKKRQQKEAEEAKKRAEEEAKREEEERQKKIAEELSEQKAAANAQQEESVDDGSAAAAGALSADSASTTSADGSTDQAPDEGEHKRQKRAEKRRRRRAKKGDVGKEAGTVGAHATSGGSAAEPASGASRNTRSGSSASQSSGSTAGRSGGDDTTSASSAAASAPPAAHSAAAGSSGSGKSKSAPVKSAGASRSRSQGSGSSSSARVSGSASAAADPPAHAAVTSSSSSSSGVRHSSSSSSSSAVGSGSSSENLPPASAIVLPVASRSAVDEILRSGRMILAPAVRSVLSRIQPGRTQVFLADAETRSLHGVFAAGTASQQHLELVRTLHAPALSLGSKMCPITLPRGVSAPAVLSNGEAAALSTRIRELGATLRAKQQQSGSGSRHAPAGTAAGASSAHSGSSSMPRTGAPGLNDTAPAASATARARPANGAARRASGSAAVPTSPAAAAVLPPDSVRLATSTGPLSPPRGATAAPAGGSRSPIGSALSPGGGPGRAVPRSPVGAEKPGDGFRATPGATKLSSAGSVPKQHSATAAAGTHRAGVDRPRGSGPGSSASSAPARASAASASDAPASAGGGFFASSPFAFGFSVFPPQGAPSESAGPGLFAHGYEFGAVDGDGSGAPSSDARMSTLRMLREGQSLAPDGHPQAGAAESAGGKQTASTAAASSGWDWREHNGGSAASGANSILDDFRSFAVSGHKEVPRDAGPAPPQSAYGVPLSHGMGGLAAGPYAYAGATSGMPDGSYAAMHDGYAGSHGVVPAAQPPHPQAFMGAPDGMMAHPGSHGAVHGHASPFDNSMGVAQADGAAWNQYRDGR